MVSGVVSLAEASVEIGMAQSQEVHGRFRGFAAWAGSVASLLANRAHPAR
ncbi:hypothetical protein Kuura_043 [Caulobacter phage Kuura]|nr:hypothetical protein Kuura_043 [Caulobacter phage Kuura]